MAYNKIKVKERQTVPIATQTKRLVAAKSSETNKAVSPVIYENNDILRSANVAALPSSTVQPLGIVSEVPMNEWDAAIPYEKLNLVTYKGGTFLAKRQNKNMPPLDTDGWRDIWMPLLNGVGISSSIVEYAVSDGQYKEPPKDGWGSEIPALEAGQYLWIRVTITYTDGERTVYYSLGAAATAAKTSDLINDGDGTSPFATEKQLQAEIDRAEGAEKTLDSRVGAIESKIPTQASPTNQLADKAFVNSSINALAAYYITYNANGDAFPTRAALLGATTFYQAGKTRVPTQNDYAIVLADDSQAKGVDGTYPTTRYSYQGGTYPAGQWDFQYIVNNTSLTQAQVDALNSGITAAGVAQIEANRVAASNAQKRADVSVRFDEVQSLTAEQKSRALSNIGGLATGAAAGGDLTGQYPNPTIKEGAVTPEKLKDGSTYVRNNAALLTTNNFGGRKLYISKIDNFLFCADKRWVVTASVYNAANGALIKEIDATHVAALFDGRVGNVGIDIEQGQYAKILFDFSQGGTTYFPGYPYGHFYLSFYAGRIAEVSNGLPHVTARVYQQKYTGQGVGWHNLVNKGNISINPNSTMIVDLQNSWYAIEQLEITVYGKGTANTDSVETGITRLAEIELFLDRDEAKPSSPFVTKYNPEVLYYSLTAPEFIEGGVSLSEKYALKSAIPDVSKFVTINTEQTITEKKNFSKGIVTSDYDMPSEDGGVRINDPAGKYTTVFSAKQIIMTNLSAEKSYNINLPSDGGTLARIEDIPSLTATNLSPLIEGNGIAYIAVHGHTIEYVRGKFATTAVATYDANGLMSSTDKKNFDDALSKLDNIVTLDTEQTITGNKAFQGDVTSTNGFVTSAKVGKLGSSRVEYLNSGINYFYRPDRTGAVGETYNYNFPKKSGVFALQEDLTNLVTTDTEQEITGTKWFDGAVYFSYPLEISEGRGHNLTRFEAGKITYTDETTLKSYEYSYPANTGTLALTTDITWANTSGKPSWIGSSKPSYSYTEITGLTDYVDNKIPDTSNLVTTDTQQTISASKTFGTGTPSANNPHTVIRILPYSGSSPMRTYGVEIEAGTSRTVYSSSGITRYVGDKSMVLMLPENGGTLALKEDLNDYVPKSGDYEIYGLKSFSRIQIGVDGGPIFETDESGCLNVGVSYGGVNFNFNDDDYARGLALNGDYGAKGQVLTSNGEFGAPKWTTIQIPTSLPPSGNAGGDLTGSYPSPTIGAGKVTKAKLSSELQSAIDKANSAVQSIPNIGITNSGSGNAVTAITASGHTLTVTKGETFAKNADLTALTSRVSTIEGKIPTQASPTNQLADKAFVNSTVQTATANFRGNWTNWAAIPTDVALYPSDYAGGYTPTVNDYLVVQNASDYLAETLTGTWRFKYTGTWATNGKNGWRPEYQVNEQPLTAAQLTALNSGITAAGVTQITTNKNDIAALKTKNTEQDTSISSLTTRVGAIETKNTSQDTAISNAANAAAAAQKSADSKVSKAGDTMTGALKFEQSACLDADGPSYLLSMTSFSAGGEVKYTHVRNLTSKGNLQWTSATHTNATGYLFDGNYIPTINTLAYWNGAYQNTSSNLTYCADGEILSKSGGTLTASAQLQRAGISKTWVKGREAAIIRTTSAGSTSSPIYAPIFSQKSANGSWEFGAYTSDIAHLSYITDTDYSSNNNVQTADYQFAANKKGVVAVTTDITWANTSGKPSWIGSSKPSYSYTEITGLTDYVDNKIPDTSNLVTTDTQQHIAAKKLFNTEIRVAGAGVILDEDETIRVGILDPKNTDQKVLVLYGAQGVVANVSGHKVTFPAKEGTIALTSDIKTYTQGTGISISTANVISTVAASTSAAGHVTTAAQTFAGLKTFNGGISIPTGATIQLAGSSGTSGQVLTSNGTSSPSWKTLPTSLKNPYSLSITVNGTTTTYDGSQTKSISITTSGGSSYTAGTGVSISPTHVISTVAASTSAAGHVTTAAQTFAGRKAFNGGINIPSGATIQLNGSSGTAGQILTSNGTSSPPFWKTLFSNRQQLFTITNISTGNKILNYSCSGYSMLVITLLDEKDEMFIESMPMSQFTSSTTNRYKIDGSDPDTSRWFIFKYVNNTTINIDNVGGFKNLIIYGVA